jgi:Ca2+-binding EF-hand superfamily protein
MHAMYKQFDKNGDGKITTEDIEIYLQEMGLGFVSPCKYSFFNSINFNIFI